MLGVWCSVGGDRGLGWCGVSFKERETQITKLGAVVWGGVLFRVVSNDGDTVGCWANACVVAV